MHALLQYIDHIYFTVHLEGIKIPELSNAVEGKRGEKEFINTSKSP